MFRVVAAANKVEERDMERIAPGPWQAHGKFVSAPGETDTYSGVVWGTIVVCHPCADTDAEGRFWSTNGSANVHACFIATAGTTAHEVAQMGYDPVEAVRALPELLKQARTLTNEAPSWSYTHGERRDEVERTIGEALINLDAAIDRATNTNQTEEN